MAAAGTAAAGTAGSSATVNVLAKGGAGLASPVVDAGTGKLLVVSTGTGALCTVEDGSVVEWVNSGGAPAGGALDHTGNIYLADLAHGSILKLDRDGSQQVMVTEYEGKAFKGPNSAVMAKNGNLFFTDSGPFGESTLAHPGGSLFCISNDKSPILRPLALRCLAHPCGVALSPAHDVVYVAEMMTNRILRFVQRPAGVFHCSVFAQLSGGVGPSALAVAADGTIFVAMFDLKEVATAGRVLALDGVTGNVKATYSVPTAELSGIAVRSDGTLIVTEGSTNRVFSITP